MVYQSTLPFVISPPQAQPVSAEDTRQLLAHLLSQNLDFHGQDSGYATHNFHSFPAKFPPQLPQYFIYNLTNPGDVVLDPMMGSGTTIVEGFLSGRRSIGFDIDPLAIKLTRVKVTPLNIQQVLQATETILAKASYHIAENKEIIIKCLEQQYNSQTKSFLDYWFALPTQIELFALNSEIQNIPSSTLRAFFELAFSAIIITKAGGVSLAFDLAHTRPHRAKLVKSASGEILFQTNEKKVSEKRIHILTKTVRPALEEFAKRVQRNLEGLIVAHTGVISPLLAYGNAQNLPLPAEVVDLIVTSPPYAVNAIDYMRAHKFSLAWMGYSVDELGQHRGKYIGGESLANVTFSDMPSYTAEIVAEITKLDTHKGRALHRYYSEMSRVLKEMFRVLKPGKTAVVVVGTSTIRNKDTETYTCLAEIGQTIGFEVPKIGVRQLDRNRRMLPAGLEINQASQIQKRMHRDYIIGFFKPKASVYSL